MRESSHESMGNATPFPVEDVEALLADFDCADAKVRDAGSVCADGRVMMMRGMGKKVGAVLYFCQP